MTFKLVKEHFIYVLFISLLYFVQYRLSHEIKIPEIKISNEASKLNLSDIYLDIFNLGQKRLISSIIWIHTLMESDLDHVNKSNNWMFLRFKTIAHLEKKFYENYKYGGLYLSIVKDDDSGAKYLFDKGLKQFPDDFTLNYHAGFHYLHELNDTKGAQEIYSHLINLPGALRRFPLLLSILTKVQTSEGQDEVAYQMLKNNLSVIKDNEYLRKSTESKLQELKTKIDLDCLNNDRKNCSKTDYFGSPYLKNSSGIWFAK